MRPGDDATMVQMNALRNDLREAQALVAKYQAEYEQLAQRRNRDVKALLRALQKCFDEIAVLKAQRLPGDPCGTQRENRSARPDSGGKARAAADREFIGVDFTTLNDGSVSFGN